MHSDNYLEKAISLLSLKPIFELEGVDIQLVCILKDSPPLEAYWHKGKQVHIIAIDVDGNFFLRHSNGSVKYWIHKTATQQDVSLSIRAFLANLREDINGKLKQ